MTQQTHGIIELSDGYKFYWILAGGRCPEISGYIEKPKGGILAGSSGWYRTDNPQHAAQIAQSKLNGARNNDNQKRNAATN